MRITIGLPMYQGAGGFTISSLLSLQEAFLKRGDVVEFDIEMGGSIIPKVRNRIVRRFLESENDYLVFIDADMVFESKDILSLVDSDHDVCALNYRNRKPKLVWMNNPLLDADGEIQAIKTRRVWIKTETAGTGLMAINKRCLEKMAACYSGSTYEDNGITIAIFDFERLDGHAYGEDYLFCRRWLDMGGEIWTLADATTGHIGGTAYTGNYESYLKGQK